MNKENLKLFLKNGVTFSFNFLFFVFFLLQIFPAIIMNIIKVFKRRFLEQGSLVDFSGTDNNARKENILHKVLKEYISATWIFQYSC